MKKIILSIVFVISAVLCYAQNDSVYYDDQQYYSQPAKQYVVDNQNYFEFALGAMIPDDDSNSYFSFDIEAGRYINKYIGLGLNFKYGQESEYHDHLGYIGPKVRFRINYSPRNLLDLDINAGLGYGWYEYNLGTGYYDYYDDYYYDGYYEYYNDYKTISYIVPNISATGYLNFNSYLSIGIEPGFMWYISTNKDESKNVGVWSITGKLKLRF
jgi:hypothetical protein